MALVQRAKMSIQFNLGDYIATVQIQYSGFWIQFRKKKNTWFDMIWYLKTVARVLVSLDHEPVC